MEGERAAHDVLATITELCQVLTEEMGHARAMRLVPLRELQEPKARLGEALHTAQARLEDAIGAQPRLSAPLKTMLRDATGRLKTLAIDNGRALRAARDINERMLRMLAEAASTAGRAPTLYARGGRAPAGAQPVSHRSSVPLAIDRRA